MACRLGGGRRWGRDVRGRAGSGGIACGLLVCSAAAFAGVTHRRSRTADAASTAVVATTTMTSSTPRGRPRHGTVRRHCPPEPWSPPLMSGPVRSGEPRRAPTRDRLRARPGRSPQDSGRSCAPGRPRATSSPRPCSPSRADRRRAGPNSRDIGDQPGDMSFVIDQVLEASAVPGTGRSRAWSTQESGTPAIPTAPSRRWARGQQCCHDPRVEAAVVVAEPPKG